jgi:hypothetical protein
LRNKNRRWETSYGGSRFQQKWDTAKICIFHWPVDLFDEGLIVLHYFLVSHDGIKFTNVYSIANIVLIRLTFNRVKFWKRIKFFSFTLTIICGLYGFVKSLKIYFRCRINGLYVFFSGSPCLLHMVKMKNNLSYLNKYLPYMHEFVQIFSQY